MRIFNTAWKRKATSLYYWATLTSTFSDLAPCPSTAQLRRLCNPIGATVALGTCSFRGSCRTPWLLPRPRAWPRHCVIVRQELTLLLQLEEPVQSPAHWWTSRHWAMGSQQRGGRMLSMMVQG